ncbi:unnamed protein product [Miscanthus lutarioriparius]|uniref:Serpin domain-containing protein n=1 Tax=Miscanthus lutarioriparius TaxID=422564 RepID=A0A811QA35_9POAL|nr:unnamed protein product [Miscanthus lutarioriparius]
MTRKGRRSGKTVPKKSSRGSRQLQLQTPPAAVVAGEPAGGPRAAAATAAAANLLFSPVAVYAALALLAVGARGGTLQELLDALGGDSRDDLAAFARRAAELALAVGRGIYFKGRWEAPFAKAHTVVDKFHRLDGSTADVPFMCSMRSQYIAIRNGYKVLKLPYRSPAPAPAPAPAPRRKGSTPSESKPGDGDDDPAPKYSMCVFLPDERDGLPGLVEKDADTAGTPLYVADVCHKAVIEVNEGGTVANGATAIYMLCGASAVMDQPVKVDFVADHPFVFFVIEEVSRAIVFVGRVLDPSISG